MVQHIEHYIIKMCKVLFPALASSFWLLFFVLFSSSINNHCTCLKVHVYIKISDCIIKKVNSLCIIYCSVNFTTVRT